MNRTVQRCGLLSLLLSLACDPGMTIHQMVPGAPDTAKSQIIVSVRSQNQLIGETHYAPTVEIRNVTDAPIRVSEIELVAEGKAFQSRSLAHDDSAHEIAPAGTETVRLWFDLSSSVHRVFHRPAELRIHYQSRGGERMANIGIVGGPLQQVAH